MERMIDVKTVYELQDYIKSNWEQEWDDDTVYFIRLQNGDVIGYSFESECFYLNNLYNEISHNEAFEMLKLYNL